MGLGFSHQFILNNAVAIDAGFITTIYTYLEKIRYDKIVLDKNYNEILVERNQNKTRVNLSIGFYVQGVFSLTRKLQLTTGISLPFILLNPNKFDIGKEFDPPMLGLEPCFTIGLKCKLKKNNRKK